jgi:Flavodoxin
MKILIVYGSLEGQTSKIAHFMKEILLDDNHDVILANATNNPLPVDKFDVILIGSSIHLNSYNPSIKKYVKNNIEELNKKITGFYSVSMAIASNLPEKHQEVNQLTQQFLTDTGWETNRIWHIEGALKFTKYDYLKKMMMRSIAQKEFGPININKDYEYTDWEKVKNHLSQFSSRLKTRLHEQA